ncbi:MAG TPA: hypothetical protein G4O19_02690 [Dehalococcoidia bacterium]|nr:hypothetical protein [Dehalococcoidia bacterium]
MWKNLIDELRAHIPFTALGATIGIVVMWIIILTDSFAGFTGISEPLFEVLHPTHVVLSAIVTTALYKKYGNGKLWAIILVGFIGSIGIATLSDSLIPYLGETLLGLPNREVHIGFIEEWYIVNPAALLGIAIGYFKPATRIPHFGHVFISTWASLAHNVMAMDVTISFLALLGIFTFLFLAVWVPCCTSDIIFPLLFTKKRLSPQHI